MVSLNKKRVACAVMTSALAACAVEGSGSSAPSGQTTLGQATGPASAAQASTMPRSEPSTATQEAIPPTASSSGGDIPQYRRIAPPPGFTEDELGLIGTLQLAAGCVVVVDKGAASVIPIFPVGSVRWREPARILSIGGRDYRSGDHVQWSVLAASRNFLEKDASAGEIAVPARCAGDRYVKVIL